MDLYKEEENKISVQWKRWPTSCKENADTSHGEVESAGRGCGPEVLDIELSANACSARKWSVVTTHPSTGLDGEG